MKSTQLCTFRLANLMLGIPVGSVQEVLRNQPMTRVPRAHAVVAGLMNLRGQIVTAIDLWCRLGLEAAPSSEWMNVIVRTPDSIASLMVDDIADVVEVDAANYEKPPTTLRESVRPFISGVYKRPAGLLLVLDTERVLDIDRAEPQRRFAKGQRFGGVRA